MKILLATCLLPMLVACSSDEAPADVSASTKTPSATNTSSVESDHEAEEVDSSRAVVQLTISGLKSEDDVEDVKEDLEWVTGVEEAKVDATTGKALILMKESFDNDDIADAVKDLRDAVSKPLTVTGFSWEYSDSKTIELEW